MQVMYIHIFWNQALLKQLWMVLMKTTITKIMMEVLTKMKRKIIIHCSANLARFMCEINLKDLVHRVVVLQIALLCYLSLIQQVFVLPQPKLLLAMILLNKYQGPIKYHKACCSLQRCGKYLMNELIPGIVLCCINDSSFILIELSMNCTSKPMALEQVFSDRDSEDEVDDDIADFEDRRMLDDFVDVTKDEKQIMHLWNSFVRKQRVLADGHIPWACEAFSQLHGQDLSRSPALMWCWRLFMIKLWNHSLLDARTMNNCNLILEICQNGSSSPKQS
ncbi:polycomb group protein EMF2B-like [Canna indica]|uniref:Polycomb group protein EMF2B-like n=1 Tax=Canna indica TaxID=4628 RepID=A0AAQ3QFB0_9LILI|nr:polycomb group protein EMF2B-like [Canna indica]